MTRKGKAMLRFIRSAAILLGALIASGCSSTGTLGMVSKGGGSAVLKSGQSFKDLGPVSGKSCRYFLLGIVPWGDGTASDATRDALEKSGGDALINATVETGLYGFIPIYQVFSYTCTTITGTAIKLEGGASAAR
jgi:hypothetical protein